MFDFGESNMADVRFGKIEHGRFSMLEHRTWPIFANMPRKRDEAVGRRPGFPNFVELASGI